MKKFKFKNLVQHFASKVLFALSLIALMPLTSCVAQNKTANLDSIKSYEACVAAGNPVLKTLPPQCALADGRVFTRGEPIPRIGDPLRLSPAGAVRPLGEVRPKGLCRDMCGDGVCQEMVCMAEGCPCSENGATCPADCR